jgi:hypothetical protein
MRKRNLQPGILVWAGLIWLLGLAPVAESKDEIFQNLEIAWPKRWELRRPDRQDAALRIRAREQDGGATLQALDLIAVDTRSATKRLDANSVGQLAARLRDAILKTAVEASIDLRPIQSDSGFYFVATDSHYREDNARSFRQLVVGVLLRSGYLINFTLLTHDAHSPETKEMISALAEMRIE